MRYGIIDMIDDSDEYECACEELESLMELSLPGRNTKRRMLHLAMLIEEYEEREHGWQDE